MATTDELIRAREDYISSIEKELLGPGSEVCIPDIEHEVISSSPQQRYSLGILFPQKSIQEVDNNETISSSEINESDNDLDLDDEVISEDDSINSERPEKSNQNDDETLDEEVSLASQNMPSSMGVTFFIKGKSDNLLCTVSFGTYRKIKASECAYPFFPDDSLNYSVPDSVSPYLKYDKENKCLRLTCGGIKAKLVRNIQDEHLLGMDPDNIIPAFYSLVAQLNQGYIREPHKCQVELAFGEKEYIDNNRNIDNSNLKITALKRNIKDQIFSITIMLVNEEEGKPEGDNCIFQPVLTISTDENEFEFVDYSGTFELSSLDDEEQSLELQYRNKKVYATGLGTAIDWNVDNIGKGDIRTTFFPKTEIPGMDFVLPESFKVDKNALSMKYLSDLNQAEKDNKISALMSLVNAYEKWINDINKESETLDAKYSHISKINIDGCSKSCERMHAGLEILKSNINAYNAFELANRAMFMQRVHILLQSQYNNRFPDDDELNAVLEKLDYNVADTMIPDKHNYTWRPFQIAFLLMSIEGIVNDKSEDRGIVDLIWFPTGGGKTEAYLGLTAFTIFYRHLACPIASDGTTVMMRYTLRLLAAQQFTRASTLICACEYIRSDATSRKPQYKKYNLGKDPITIGLWIGGNHTPNTVAEAKKDVDYLNSITSANEIENAKDKHYSFQLLRCPWCGTKLVRENVDGHLKGEFGFRMSNGKSFQLRCPQSSCFFYEEGVLPVQVVDEELYKNPPTLLFGTVDKFAMLPWKKEVGNFFGVNSNNRSPELIIQDELHLISGPLGTMVGLYETAIDALSSIKGIKPKIIASTATIRRAKEQCAQLYDRPVAQFPHPGIDAEDSFFARESIVNHSEGSYGRTYIGLLPSGKSKATFEVRVIASMLQLMETMDLPDEIKDKYWTLTVYFNSLKELGKCSTLVDDDVKSFIRILSVRDNTKKRMINYADELTSRVTTTKLNATLEKLEKLEYSQKNIEEKNYASNVLLATNMISVGIDVARLNSMLIVGQPKLTSEYIQVSSRIGRSYPGLVLTMYDSTKSRDRSHYEQFQAYHDSFYKYVEPTSVTPFSGPARERALHAVVISLMRNYVKELSNDNSASLFSETNYMQQMGKIKQIILQRYKSITNRLPNAGNDESDEICKEIDEIFDKWKHLAEKYSDDLSYGEKYTRKHIEKDQGRLLKQFDSDENDLDAFDTMTSMRNVDAEVGARLLVWEKNHE